MRRKSDCGFSLYFVKHVLEFLILIYVFYKSGVNLNSYGVWSYSHVPICLCMDKWALCDHFYSYVDLVWSLYNIRTGFHVIAQVVFWVELSVQRRLPDFRLILGPGKRGLNGVVPGYPTSTNLLRVDGLSMDPRDLGRQSLVSELRNTNT